MHEETKDDEERFLVNLLQHEASVIKVNGLSSGVVEGIHGQVIVDKTVWLYQLKERQVSLYRK
jgi:hypothetical protein